eukprot:TRINITY_DN4225_c0_g1_i3.p1 TRINITY_DN4225_c0_g1~~TRINITY_DN4225_c0_g1_i3.p1  ORF type:complete len:378 (-),score=93.47 TRINITY_DN4225_c0_g1_i3:807-1898(-)
MGGRALRVAAALSLAVSFLHGAQAVKFKGFSADNPKPIVPVDDDNLLVEHIWTWQYDDRAVMIKFVPGSDQVISVHKAGNVRLYDNLQSDPYYYKHLVDMTADTYDLGDHGLLAMEYHPDWDAGVRKIFVLYTGEPKDVRQLPNNDAVEDDRPTSWGKGPPGKHGQLWPDSCPCLDCDGAGKNRDGLICEHPYYIDRISVDLDAGTSKKDVTLLSVMCGSSDTHGPGDLKVIGKDLIYSTGEGSQFTVFDYGFEDDGCYDPDQTAGQGSFRAIRETFGNGKIGRIPYNLLDSDSEISLDQVELVAKGVRQPVRLFHHEQQDRLYVGMYIMSIVSSALCDWRAAVSSMRQLVRLFLHKAQAGCT